MTHQESREQGVTENVTAQNFYTQNQADSPPYGSQFQGNQYPYQGKIRVTQPKHFEGRDALFAALMLVCGFLFIHLETFFQGSKGLGVTLSSAAFVGVAWLYMQQSGFRQHKESYLYLALMAVTALRFVLFHGLWVDTYGILLLMVLAVYWIATTTGRRLVDTISPLSLGDLLNQFICVPFSNFSCCFAGIASGLGKSKKGKGLAGALLGLLIFAPVLVIVTSLLVSADFAFEIWVDNFLDRFFADMFLHVVEFVFGIPIACYLFGLLYGNIKGRYATRITAQSVHKNTKALQFAPASTIYTCLGALCLIYLAFFAAQASYLFSAFENQLPAALTYAEYARRGFFELCQVAAINLAVITAAYLLLRRTEGETGVPKLLKIFTALISLMTLVLIATALKKMLMYIQVYGLTQPRIYTTWFMGVLFLLFCLLIVRQIKNFSLSKTSVLVVVVAFLVLSYSNVEGQIARYNLARYEARTLADLSFSGPSGLNSLADGAVPYIIETFTNTEDEELKYQLANVLYEYSLRYHYKGIDEGGLRYWNLQTARAYKEIEALRPQLEALLWAE